MCSCIVSMLQYILSICSNIYRQYAPLYCVSMLQYISSVCSNTYRQYAPIYIVGMLQYMSSVCSNIYRQYAPIYIVSMLQYISSVCSNIYPTRCNVTQFIYIWKLIYMFRVVPPPIIRSAYNCIYSIWYLSDRYCYLPL